MTKNQILTQINEQAKKILKESLPWCYNDDQKISDRGISINKAAHEISLLLEEYQQRRDRED
jgi:hypothetical protein